MYKILVKLKGQPARFFSGQWNTVEEANQYIKNIAQNQAAELDENLHVEYARIYKQELTLVTEVFPMPS